ncbi:hypothetical protein [Lentilitoribacter sp. Alg239-R112]|uniref:hypothetical protein n=1 Tax=Lentilitoribacter sp. Alg239-R112 TaxID=2305987 RepID=UPI0013A6C25A|nr:hypothetical protein [Lentilitoribacter sp. Alg239-R112]
MTKDQPEFEKQPLITPNFLWRVTSAIGALLIATLIIYIGGNYWSKSISHGGHTVDQSKHNITIGKGTLSVTANSIRFSEQRRDGVTSRLNLYFNWPDFTGYTKENAGDFNDAGEDPNVIFVDVAKSNGQMDMSSRFNPIYRNFIDSAPLEGPGELVYYRMSDSSNFKGELIYTERLVKERPFVIKCLADTTNNKTPSATECQRDINIIGNLSVTYRYSQHLLPHWEAIESKLIKFLQLTLKVH